ncbi:MAG: trypsin-like peptidase domain-containing protein [Phycisphaeraceae bacterium]|nr:trypsin-like peptidase domain-containing protein [Phycisphaeraceae bacterium]
MLHRTHIALGVAFALGAATGGVAQPVHDSGGAASSALHGSGQLDFRQVVQQGKSRVFPAVVFIKCVRENNMGGEKKSAEVSGSGVLISPEGEVLTNWHVIDKAESVRCLLSDGRHFPAKVLGSDKDTDLALIALQTDAGTGSLPYASLGDSTVIKEGDFVMAMGAPWGLNRSVSIGIISCARRFLPEVSEYSLWFQTDAAINPGNSGGPMVNTAGEVVGINSRGMSGWAEGMGFAIPSETVKYMVPQLREHGHVDWTWFGLQLQPLRDFNRDMYFEGVDGVIVAETDPDSPARSAGLQPRDRLLAVNGTPLNGVTEEDLPAIRRTLGLLAKGEPATFAVRRGTESLSFSIVPREKGKVEGEELACKRWDLTAKSINQFDNPELYFHRQTGVFIYAVKYPGNASSGGLRTNDILLKIEGKDVESLADVEAIHKESLASIEKKSRVVFSVLRGGLMRQVVVDCTRDYSKE